MYRLTCKIPNTDKAVTCLCVEDDLLVSIKCLLKFGWKVEVTL